MTKNILKHLNVKEHSPTLQYLQELITAYCSIVPWENVSKIVKKTVCNKPADCVRLEEEFWTQSFKYGTGGTCYESNWAFYKLLKTLGFDCYLTINKIADKSSVHSAIIVTINRSGYIADIGYPLYAPIPIVENGIHHSKYEGTTYRSTCIGNNEYLIENFPHPKPYLYHLSDIPVSEQDYLKVAIADYCDSGLFLDRIIIRKIINNTPTRFDSQDLPYNIHQLQNGTKTRNSIGEENLFNALSEFYSLNMDVISKAFEILKRRTTPHV
ncbi:MAG: arylamine N-acetyltransferase [Chitinophagaceae bacterium]|nr:MAG: arylamine N-acetyltransferase [Chitinophagaceae bacterium]